MRHSPEDFGLARWVLAQGRRETRPDRRHDRRAMVVLVAVLLFHALGHPGLHRDWCEDAHRKGIATARSHQRQDGPGDQHQGPHLSHPALPSFWVSRSPFCARGLPASAKWQAAIGKYRKPAAATLTDCAKLARREGGVDARE